VGGQRDAHPLEAAQPYHRVSRHRAVADPVAGLFGHPHVALLADHPPACIGWQSMVVSANSRPAVSRSPVTTPVMASPLRCHRVNSTHHSQLPLMAAVTLSVSTVKPLGDRIFIKVSESEERTAGGILLPDTAKEKPQVGEVVQVGPGRRNDDGSRQAPEVSVGDKVLYSKYAGTDIKLGADEYVLLSEKDILAVVN